MAVRSYVGGGGRAPPTGRQGAGLRQRVSLTASLRCQTERARRFLRFPDQEAVSRWVRRLLRIPARSARAQSPGQLCAVPSNNPCFRRLVSRLFRSSHPRASSVVFMSLLDENELLRSHWYLYWGNIA